MLALLSGRWVRARTSLTRGNGSPMLQARATVGRGVSARTLEGVGPTPMSGGRSRCSRALRIPARHIEIEVEQDGNRSCFRHDDDFSG
jgi:hypothetical protein